MKAAVAKIRSAFIKTPVEKSRRKFLKHFPNGFHDEKYLAWERGYKWAAHKRWLELLSADEFQKLLDKKDFAGIGSRALRIIAGTNLIFSFESMALRDALKDKKGVRLFAEGLFEYIYGRGPVDERFDAWVEMISALPKRQSRVLTHPVATVFGFIAQPDRHIFLKPMVTRSAALAYGFDLKYASRPSWAVYSSLLDFAAVVRHDIADLAPRDMIDIQSFIWVLGSDEYR